MLAEGIAPTRTRYRKGMEDDPGTPLQIPSLVTPGEVSSGTADPSWEIQLRAVSLTQAMKGVGHGEPIRFC